VDGRYLWCALALFVALGAWEYLCGFNAAAAFLFPFVAVVLVFMGLLGDSPSARTLHWMSDDPLK
jgi:hypothetical protein